MRDPATRRRGDTANGATGPDSAASPRHLLAASQTAASPRRPLTASQNESRHPVAGSHLVPLPRDFYLRPTVEVARDLLGRYLVLDRPDEPPYTARLVETEAYLGEEDLACHASRGHTKRTAPMYEEAGHAYIYFIYGMYWCLNVVTEAVGRPYAVLLRAAESISDLPAMNGPGKLCRALGLDGSSNRADLTSSGLRVTEGVPLPTERLGCSRRIGVAYAGPWADEPLRFFDKESRAVSRLPSPGKGRLRPSKAEINGTGEARP